MSRALSPPPVPSGVFMFPALKSAVRRHRRAHVAGLIGAVCALLVGYAVVVAGPAGAADSLLSQGKPTTASSSENAGTAAPAATDGNPTTRWSSAFTDPQWLQVDLGATATIS